MENEVRLTIYGSFFSHAFLSREDGLVLSWAAETSIGNLSWRKIVCINWRWPFIKCLEFVFEPGTDKHWLVENVINK